MNSTIKYIAIGMGMAMFMTSCYKETLITGGDGLSDWTTDSHSAIATPDYGQIFPDDAVQRIDLEIDPDDWESMQDNLGDILAGAGGGQGTFSDETPMYVPCQMWYNGKQWYNVGVRYKGNSSLQGPFDNGIGKLPLRLEFDYFEDDYPEITGQTFYGFSQLSLSSNYDDQSVIREKVVADIFRDFGVPAPRTSFYCIFVDYGDGPVYFGLYTVIEVVFDGPMLDAQFGSSNGNCYKPDGTAASFADGTFSTSEFEIKSGTSDWTDIEQLFSVLHSSERTTNEAQWRSNLESIFDVDGFLKYLAANGTLQNWDTYGRMTHNYYLYDDPADGKIKWIPWDNNEALQEGKRGGSVQLDFSDVNTNEWPLMGYLYDNATYRTQYEQHMDDFINGTFSPARMQPIYTAASALIEPYVVGSDGEIDGYTFVDGASGYSSALNDLNSHVSERFTTADNYLN